MKKIGVLVAFLVMLSGCSDSSEELEQGMELRAKLLQGTSCTFEAEITADYGDKIHNFSMQCQGDSAGNLSFQVTAPETISGITGKIAEDGGKLTFEDTALYFELLTDDQISPVTAPWILLRTLRGGYLTSACREDGLVRLTLDDSFEEDALQVDIWLNEANAPVRGEILYDGRRILSLRVKNFEIV